ncbi:Z1 domain-containing protein [Rhodococcus qingshengii]|uniref:Z1 domain-containing protein n=1 Tax=Rhodococcus qingshengii TaxID=334542 RepID=UPI0005AB30A2|nr:Z1 domain-containing protein [Rhodococcus qingshengii]MCD2133343.1 Z1 domain-containing protein [Rhodococcus qingshengii]
MSNIDQLQIDLHTAALADMDASRPKKLLRALAYQAEDLSPDAENLVSEEDFCITLKSAQSVDPIIEIWRRQLTRWDFINKPIWSQSESRTDARRREIYDYLDLGEDTRTLLDQLIPIATIDRPVVVSEEFEPWYLPDTVHSKGWYWSAYRKLLLDKGWPDEAVASLDEASNQVVERLANPINAEAYQSKGLVVGYVQSGKTANFTGVISKSVDAGYRLVIVLGGTLNVLRRQTQRRLDMELVGRENILRGTNEYESDYADDPAWSQDKFLKFGERPSVLGAFDIIRMTTREKDYEALLQGIEALEVEKKDRSLPLYDPRNLHSSSARLMVVKKNKDVLTKLVKDLKRLTTPLAEIPVLIIDDESDEASVNTSDLAKPNAERTAINVKIGELLKMLPRAQYVGYTATPFANVFIDPSDAEDIFPKDFILSLPRPIGYMGARDFHDLDSALSPQERTIFNSNEKAHVRDIVTVDGEDDDSLQKAMDMFVLSAAVKLYREAEGGMGDGYFPHHTMLIHESRLTNDHRELLGRVSKLWWNSGYTSSDGHARLRELFDTDVAPVSAVRSGVHAVPGSYDQLVKHIGPAAFRIGGDLKPIIVVNGDKDLDTGDADFDKRSIWKILIGGQKLSRGFTVEGLTVTYFRRNATSASALMQMGRWFGFREGYRDLVRLYVGREETVGKRSVDLYESFEAICLDEENFRSELARYSQLKDGRALITPAQVPPLVSQHLPALKPTSPNKMYNAQLVEMATPGEWKEFTAYPKKITDLRTNTAIWTPILESLSPLSSEIEIVSPRVGSVESAVALGFTALAGRVDRTQLFELLENLRWCAPSQFFPHLAYLRVITDRELVDDWLVLAPQHNTARLDPGEGQVANWGTSRSYSYFSRDRRREPLFGAISDPKHRPGPIKIAQNRLLRVPGDEHPRTSTRTGVVVLYPIVERVNRPERGPISNVDPGKIVMAFSVVAPVAVDGYPPIVFTTHDSSKSAPIIDVVSG